MINIGSGEGVSIGDLANTVLHLMGRDIPIISDVQRIRPQESEVDKLCADNSKARQLLGWQPQYTLEAGLARVIDWIKSNLDSYPKGIYST